MDPDEENQAYRAALLQLLLLPYGTASGSCPAGAHVHANIEQLDGWVAMVLDLVRALGDCNVPAC